MLRKWDELPDFMRCEEIRPYYDSLSGKRTQLSIKRVADFVLAGCLLLFFSVPMIIIAIMVKLDSRGPAFFRQKRVTAYGRYFNIHKFRTMYVDKRNPSDLISIPADRGSDNAGRNTSNLTSGDDRRITGIGAFLRETCLDELPQLLDVLSGHMSFVGTRPEIPAYVKQYSKEMYATLLLPAGITSRASIRFRDEADLLNGMNESERDKIYLEEILPEKMKDNLHDVMHFSIWSDLITLVRTVLCIL